MSRTTHPNPPGQADVLTLGFGTSLTMWVVGYACRLPESGVPGWLLLVLLLACLFGGGFAAGRYTERGWRGGLYAGLLSAVLNLLILGSLLGGDQPNRVVPSALWWLPGSFIVAGVLGSIGAAAGCLAPSRPADPPNWTGAFARLAVAAALFLLIVGGLVTSYEAGLAVADWPNSFEYNMFLYPLSRMTGGIYYEHAHRLVGSLVGLTTLVLAIHLQLIEQRKWVRGSAWIGLVVVIVQGVLGGLRVTGHLTLSTEDTAPNITLAVVHGVVGQVFFGIVVALSVAAGTAWHRVQAATPRPSAGADRKLSILLIGMLLVQLTLGAVLRHESYGIHLHITVAVFVVLLAVACGVRAWGLYSDQPRLPQVGKTLLALIALQIALGFGALVSANLDAGAESRPAADVILTTAHQTVGAVLLAWAVVLMLWNHRLLLPDVGRNKVRTTLPAGSTA